MTLTTHTPLIKGVALQKLIKGVGLRMRYKTRGFGQSTPLTKRVSPTPLINGVWVVRGCDTSDHVGTEYDKRGHSPAED